jgi:hypothetical protein
VEAEGIYIPNQILDKAAEKLLDLLVSRRDLACPIPMTCFFANVGLVPKPPSNDPLLHLRPVDYEKDKVRVYIDLARYFLERLGDNIFSMVEGDPRLVKNLPSWVPDWTSASDPLYIPLTKYLEWRRGTWVYRSPI